MKKQTVETTALARVEPIKVELNHEVLAKYCNHTEVAFGISSSTDYIFTNHGSNILGVAHCDTVCDSGFYAVDKRAGIAFSPALDDRLGVYTLLYALPRMGIQIDTLLTTGEESFNSTAILFKSEKQYNWIVEFDRAGVGAVTYDYDKDGWDDIVRKYFISVGKGTFSDISELEFLNCKALNVAIGYEGAHTLGCYFIADDYISQMRKFVSFYSTYKDTYFPHKEKFNGIKYVKWTNTTSTWPQGGSGWKQYNNNRREYETNTVKKHNKTNGIVEDYLYSEELQQWIPTSEWEDEIEYADDVHVQCLLCGETFWEEETVSCLSGFMCYFCGVPISYQDGTAIVVGEEDVESSGEDGYGGLI